MSVVAPAFYLHGISFTRSVLSDIVRCFKLTFSYGKAFDLISGRAGVSGDDL